MAPLPTITRESGLVSPLHMQLPQGLPVPNANPGRELVYLQDNQLYYVTPIKFETNCPWAVERLSALSWNAPSAGRLSASFAEFQKLMKAEGFTCKLIERFADKSSPPAGFEQVVGATGNY
jgi:hypothetical protein